MSPEFSETSEKSREVIRGQLLSDKGIGAPIVTEFLISVPGINKNIVTEQIANLKASGDYQRIIELADEYVL
jgi:hypothetical protein